MPSLTSFRSLQSRRAVSSRIAIRRSSMHSPWNGSLLFDTARHRQRLGLPVDYLRLNQWQERWVAEPDCRSSVTVWDAGRVVADGDPGSGAFGPLNRSPASTTSAR